MISLICHHLNNLQPCIRRGLVQDGAQEAAGWALIDKDTHMVPIPHRVTTRTLAALLTRTPAWLPLTIISALHLESFQFIYLSLKTKPFYLGHLKLLIDPRINLTKLLGTINMVYLNPYYLRKKKEKKEKEKLPQ